MGREDGMEWRRPVDTLPGQLEEWVRKPVPRHRLLCAIHALPLYTRAFPAFAFVLLAIVIAGCQTASPASNEVAPAGAPPAAGEADAPEVCSVVLHSGDSVAIRFLHWPELNDMQLIRPDGRLSLAMVGEVEADGLTPAELSDRLTTLYAPKIKNPVINVVVQAFGSRRIYVGGEVLAPGVQVLQGQMTVMGAIMQAGGFRKESAKLRNVVVLREHNGKREAHLLNLRKSLHNQESDIFYLAPYDVVYVPRSAIDHVDQWVEQYVNRIIPRNVSLFFLYSLN